MKKWLRKWLGIHAVNQTDSSRQQFITKSILREEIVASLREALSPDYRTSLSTRYIGIRFDPEELLSIRGAVDKLIRLKVSEEAEAIKNNCESTVSAAIDGEQFIDSVVERINRKQVGK